MCAAMNGLVPHKTFDEILPLAPFETMASASADAAIAETWPSGPDEEQEPEDEADDAERAIQEDLLRELPSASAQPLRSAMRRRPVTDDDDDDEDGDVGGRPGGDGDSDQEVGEEEQQVSKDESSFASEDEREPSPLLPAFDSDFSSSDDSQLTIGDEEVGAFEDDSDDDGEWVTARDCEPEDDSAAKKRAAAKKKAKARASASKKAAAAAPAANGKRKRAPPGADEKQARRQALELRKTELNAKMSKEEQLQVMQAYIKLAAIDKLMEREHLEGGGRTEEYTSFRTIVLAEASGDDVTDDVRQLALAVIDIDADITGTLAEAKKSEPESMQLLVDFVTDTSALTIDAVDVPGTATRCDVTLRPSAPDQLVCATVTPRSAPGAPRRLVMLATLKNLVLHVWTLANFYTATCLQVGGVLGKLLRRKPPLDESALLLALDADALLAERLRKKLAEAHQKVCWHVNMSLKKS